MNDFLENLKRQAEDNPIVAIGVGAALITAVSKLLSAKTEWKNAVSWDRETARRLMKDAKK